jgi:hypothetical protein
LSERIQVGKEEETREMVRRGRKRINGMEKKRLWKLAKEGVLTPSHDKGRGTFMTCALHGEAGFSHRS